MKIFLLFLTFVILQRLSELMLAKRNEKTVRSEGAVEYDALIDPAPSADIFSDGLED